MSTDPTPSREPGLDSPLMDALVGTRRYTRSRVSDDHRTLHIEGGRSADDFYRDRWSHDKVVRSTHGVICTGSCSWKVYVKDGIITWESQQTDYPSVGPDRPEYEPRGCPRGAAFSWYTYSPTRVRYPYVRGVLLEMYREARHRLGDPVSAWADIVSDPERSRRYKAARGKGGLVRATWDEAVEMVAAAHVHTIKEYGPDRVAGFSPIPAMSMVSHASGARFVSLIGGAMLSFYDWYADLPVASPQVFGDQTDVPESGDWWDAGYLILWGSNVPVTRTPEAHWMTEARGSRPAAVRPAGVQAEPGGPTPVNDVAAADLLLWVVLPYVCLAVFVVGHFWRYRYDKFGWTTRSSQLYESTLLRNGSPMFHFGILVVFLGHVMGLGVPKSWTEAVGVSDGPIPLHGRVAGGPLPASAPSSGWRS